MSTVLVVEDQFLESYELECLLKDEGYDVRHAATQRDAMSLVRVLSSGGKLVAIVCDNRLINGQPAAASLYRAIRRHHAAMPFIIYSGWPPEDMPQDDSHLKIVRKPFADRVLAEVRTFAPLQAQGRPLQVPLPHHEAA